MWECDGTVLVTHSRENEECRQAFSMALERGPVGSNVPNPDRVLTPELDCPAEPQVDVTPPTAKVSGAWDPAAKRYALALSMKDGPAECEIRR